MNFWRDKDTSVHCVSDPRMSLRPVLPSTTTTSQDTSGDSYAPVVIIASSVGIVMVISFVGWLLT